MFQYYVWGRPELMLPRDSLITAHPFDIISYNGEVNMMQPSKCPQMSYARLDKYCEEHTVYIYPARVISQPG